MTSYASQKAEISEFDWTDDRYLAKQLAFVDELGKTHFGTPLRGNETDIRVLQRILDEELIRATNKESLQALGAALGQIYASHKDLEWRIYNDEHGRSRAVCVPNTQYCLFPITMLSRRIEHGAKKPSVSRIYKKGLTLIEPDLPFRPFTKPLDRD